jgi:hypothetical protein
MNWKEWKNRIKKSWIFLAGSSRQRQAEGYGMSESEGQLVEAAAEDVGSHWIVGLHQGQQSVPSSWSAACHIFYKDYGQCCKFDKYG